MYPTPPEEPSRQSSLPLVLGIVTLGGILLFLIVISGGFFLYVVFACFLVFGIGFLHYLLWGQSMDRATEGVREEERINQEREEDRW